MVVGYVIYLLFSDKEKYSKLPATMSPKEVKVWCLIRDAQETVWGANLIFNNSRFLGWNLRIALYIAMLVVYVLFILAQLYVDIKIKKS